MTEPKPNYKTRGNRIEYELTPQEAAIVDWLRRNCNNGRIWSGVVRYEPTTATIARFELRPDGRE